jgi:hypothetical protein
MSLPDSEYLGKIWCPGCEPERDEILEILEIRWCETHYPNRTGTADEAVNTSAYLSGSAEAGGPDNALWCDIFHRGKG